MGLAGMMVIGDASFFRSPANGELLNLVSQLWG